MSTAPGDGGSSFSWPPTTSDLAAIDVMEFSTEAGPAPHRREDPRPAPARARHGTAAHRATRGRHAPRPGHLMLIGLGMLVGLGLPDIGARSSSASPDVERLLTMQALLRGEQTTDAGATSTAHPASHAHDRAPIEPATNADVMSDTTASARHADAVSDATMAPDGMSGSDAASSAGSPAPDATPTPVATPAPRARGSNTDPYTAPVRDVVRAFEAAWTRMDTSATLSVWPTANAAVLTRAFTNMREQRLRLAPCRVERRGARATATCEGTLRYRPRVGDHSTRVRRDTWDFQLERSPDGWVIGRLDTK